MASEHLNLNMLLFYIGTTFIALEIIVHISPYFSTTYSIPVVGQRTKASCVSIIHNLIWDPKPPQSNSSFWAWPTTEETSRCRFTKFSQSDISILFNNSWVVVAGDSQARFFLLSFLNLLLGEVEMQNRQPDLFKRHSNYHVLVESVGAEVDFIWAPYSTNLTAMLKSFPSEQRYPDVLIMSAGLWHMLHCSNAIDYGISLSLLRDSVVSLPSTYPMLRTDGRDLPHMFWIGMPSLIDSMLNTEQKKERMRKEIYNAYDRELTVSGLLRETGGPLILLDMKSLSNHCGHHCTTDGMHYDAIVYEAAVQIMLNMLLIGSRS